MKSSVAILYFARSAAAEAEAKRLVAPRRRNRRLWSGLDARTRRRLEGSGLPWYHYDERLQSGDTFGERLARATGEVFARGYASVIIVGNDCPRLRISDLRTAARSLENGRSVLGRDRRGGAWLIGMGRDAFCAESFTGLAWQTEGVFQELVDYLGKEVESTREGGFSSEVSRSGPPRCKPTDRGDTPRRSSFLDTSEEVASVHLLRTLTDLNRATDARRLAESLRHDRLLALGVDWERPEFRPETELLPVVSLFVGPRPARRGPPRLVRA